MTAPFEGIATVPADDTGPVRCATVDPGADAAVIVARLTGLSVADASALVDTHIERGTE